MIKLLFCFLSFDCLFYPRSDKKKNENSEWKRQRGVRGCLYSIPNSLCISFFFSPLDLAFRRFSIAAFHSLSLLSTPLCCIYYPTLPLTLLSLPSLSSVICAPPEIRGFSTLATLVWGSSKTLPSSSPHIQLTHLISLGFFF